MNRDARYPVQVILFPGEKSPNLHPKIRKQISCHNFRVLYRDEIVKFLQDWNYKDDAKADYN